MNANHDLFFFVFLNFFFLPLQPDMIRREGYYAESHIVETEDGYLLTMHRIPGAVGSPDAGMKIKKKPSVILQHGLLSSSADWVITGKGKALGKFDKRVMMIIIYASSK